MIIFSYLILYPLALKLWFMSSHLIASVSYDAIILVGSSDIDEDDDIVFGVCKFDG
jgi:hypothetical protein